ncbi:asparagine synthase (glutamine-hydrolyzing) [Tengunoibacter tsumagoiensis]|uniref:asparagine synthase (glutamine-hydrolyzing) n=1 Tax=Tengunoibacter tsumagoiensis TaxID=2014871 RepID=A0A402AA42_9CHLR|nr:asparagine synthase (glutamine-hydrolyzing) [Tengunoibacter tsumagoiensis]GCE15968.1 asparagine synthetase B [Tengunoibacter tsumagoiensis]
MCGITGWVDWVDDLSNQRSALEHMSATLGHRGPDLAGSWLSSHAALAHRRLIVIDPDCGPQPFVYNEKYALTYNGEIYNFRELRQELENLGHRFRTHSDTEVLLHCYLEWGENCVQRLNGIFAFGLWDEEKQRLLLVRDHLGVKPLFYTQRGSAILFASELKALLAHPLVQPEVDRENLASILLPIGHQPGSSGYRNIHELRPGHMVLCERERTQTITYWSLQSAPHTDDLKATEEHLRFLLDDIVRRQLIADVPVVTMLSGGLDSSGLTALAGREFQRAGKTLSSYSIDFVDSATHFENQTLRPSLDAPWVQRVAEHVGTDHHTCMIDTPELVENLLIPMRAHDLPALGQMETSLYIMCKAMKQNATVALSGESADEVFGGYPWFHNERAISTPTFPWFVSMGVERDSDVPSQQRSLSGWLNEDFSRKLQLDQFAARQYEATLAEVPYLEGEDRRAARMREIFYLNLTWFLPMLLDRKDRMSMAVGFEVRVPFCDYRLVEYAWNIPWDMKNTGQIEKGILRNAFSDVLPDDVRNRKKSAYPATQNPSYLKAMQEWTLSILSATNEPVHALINPRVVEAIVRGNVQLPSTEMVVSLCESVIQLNAWLKEYHVKLVL